MAKSLKSNSRLRVQLFEARLERLRSRLRWVVVFIGFDAYEVWGLRGRIRVKGEINGFSFRTSLFPSRGMHHFLLVNKGMQKGGAVREGDLAQIMLEPDFEQRIAQIPSQLAGILKAERSLEGWYGKLNDSTRADIAKWIGQPKSEEAKVRRADQIAERLYAVMEGEKELPPILRHAFAQRPRAREGWDSMSMSRRRGELFAIFYYRTPEARAKRIAKVMDAAELFRERKLKK